MHINPQNIYETGLWLPLFDRFYVLSQEVIILTLIINFHAILLLRIDSPEQYLKKSTIFFFQQ